MDGELLSTPEPFIADIARERSSSRRHTGVTGQAGLGLERPAARPARRSLSVAMATQVQAQVFQQHKGFVAVRTFVLSLG